MPTLEEMLEAAKRFDVQATQFAMDKAEVLRNIAKYVQRHGDFASERQAGYAVKLVEWSKPKGQSTAAVNSKAIERIRQLFVTARSKGLKWPKIRLRTTQGEPLVIHEAGDRSKYKGDLILTSGEGFAQNKWFGHIKGAELFQSSAMTPSIKALIFALGDDPTRVAESYGRLTGQCCFCGRPLADGRSVAVGYGPICADKFGLQWGENQVEPVKEKAEV
jgi:hypothetical protein